MIFFQKVKTIKSKTGNVHFERWAIFETKYLSLYIHKIHKEDKDLHLHSHPWNFASIILKGSYIEEKLSIDLFGEEQPPILNTKKFLTISVMDRDDFHKIKSIVNGPVWSLFLTWGEHKNWYYWVNYVRIESDNYREIKNTVGFKI